MSHDVTPLGDPIGHIVPGWTTRPWPPRTAMEGRFCRLEPLSVERHAADLHAANSLDADGRMWTWMPKGPFDGLESFQAWVRSVETSDDPMFFAVVDNATGKAVGAASYLRVDPANGAVEVGWIQWSPLLQRRPAATEAMYLMMARVFDELGYRRYEWKCNDLNGASKRAAERLGFTYEGLFRQAAVVKGRNRDTAWYAMLDREWPAVKAGFKAWLDPANFDSEGRQVRSLEACRAG